MLQSEVDEEPVELDNADDDLPVTHRNNALSTSSSSPSSSAVAAAAAAAAAAAGAGKPPLVNAEDDDSTAAGTASPSRAPAQPQPSHAQPPQWHTHALPADQAAAASSSSPSSAQQQQREAGDDGGQLAEVSTDDIVFIIMTSSKTEARAAAALRTWARGLEHVLLISDESNPGLGSITFEEVAGRRVSDPDTSSSYQEEAQSRQIWGIKVRAAPLRAPRPRIFSRLCRRKLVFLFMLP